MLSDADKEQLNLLATNESFVWSEFEKHSRCSLLRIMVPMEYEGLGVDGVWNKQQAFFFEVHVTPRRNIVFLPSDSCVPKGLFLHASNRVMFVPAFIKRMLGHDVLSSEVMTELANRPIDELISSVINAAKNDGQRRYSGGLSTVTKQKKSFTVLSVDEEITPTLRQKPNLNNCELLSTSVSVGSNYGLYFSPGAMESIQRHIGWGKYTTSNVVEQGGVYVGTPHSNSNGYEFGVVEAAIPARSTAGTGTYVEFTHKIWANLLEEFDSGKADGRFDKQWVILGWYHTHPNNLSVFMSGTDMNTQQNLFNKNWNSAIVLNPHRQFLAGFCGAAASSCPVFALNGKVSNSI